MFYAFFCLSGKLNKIQISLECSHLARRTCLLGLNKWLLLLQLCGLETTGPAIMTQ